MKGENLYKFNFLDDNSDVETNEVLKKLDELSYVICDEVANETGGINLKITKGNVPVVILSKKERKTILKNYILLSRFYMEAHFLNREIYLSKDFTSKPFSYNMAGEDYIPLVYIDSPHHNYFDKILNEKPDNVIFIIEKNIVIRKKNFIYVYHYLRNNYVENYSLNFILINRRIMPSFKEIMLKVVNTMKNTGYIKSSNYRNFVEEVFLKFYFSNVLARILKEKS